MSNSVTATTRISTDYFPIPSSRVQESGPEDATRSAVLRPHLKLPASAEGYTSRVIEFPVSQDQSPGLRSIN